MTIYFIALTLSCVFAGILTIRQKYYISNYSFGKLKTHVLLLGTFLPLFLVSALRYNVGVDYQNYINVFNRIQNNLPVHTEPIFNAIVKYVQKNAWNQQWIFCAFSFLTVFIFIKAIYDQSKNFVFSIFLFVCLGYYFYTFNSIRYYVAVAIALYSIKFLAKDRYILFLVCICLGSLFHKSIFIVILLYPLCKLRLKMSYIVMTNYIGLALLFFKNYIKKLIFVFYPSYQNSVYDNEAVSYFNILLSILLLILSVVYYRNSIAGKKVSIIHFNMIIGSFLIYTYCWWIPTVSRIGYYFIVSSIIHLPNLLEGEKNLKNRHCIIFYLSALFLVFIIIVLQRAKGVTPLLLPYQTVFHQ